MKSFSRFLLACAFSLAAMGAVACSDDSSSPASSNDEKKSADSWNEIQVFDAKSDLPNCDKIRESYVCDEGEWVKASKAEGAAGGCLKGDENGIVVEEWNYIEHEITL